MKKLFIAAAFIIAMYAMFVNMTMTSGTGTIKASIGLDSFDVVYKRVGKTNLRLDLYAPTNKVYDKTPLIVYFHGGAWFLGDKKTDIKGLSGLFNTLRERGYAVASVDYRLLSQNAPFPACIEDCTDAIRYLVSNSDKYALDPDRIATMGSSAGGHLALLAGLDGNAYKTNDSKDYSVKCIIDLFGPSSFVDLDSSTISKSLATDIFFGFSTNYEMYIMASPLFQLNKTSPPIFIAHGNQDTVVNIKNSQVLYNRARELGIEAEFITVQNAEHGLMVADPNLPQNPTIGEVTDRLIVFISKNMR